MSLKSEQNDVDEHILEHKERSELMAIASALGINPGTKARKSDIITMIIQATKGVDLADEPKNGQAELDGDPEILVNDEMPEKVHVSEDGSNPDHDTKLQDNKLVGSEPATTEEVLAPISIADEKDAQVASQSSSETSETVAPELSGEPTMVTKIDGESVEVVETPASLRSPEGGSRRKKKRNRGRIDSVDQPYEGETFPIEGILDLRDEGYGFIRAVGYLPSSKDVYVSVSMAKKNGLRKGDFIVGEQRPANSNEKYPALVKLNSVCGLDPEAAKARPKFEELTPLFPDEKLCMEIPGSNNDLTGRIVDLLSPIGKGQRGLIVSPPKAGKTTIMKQIARAIEHNNPEVVLMVLLVDERPEEVTDMRRSVKGEVVASTFDKPTEEHTQVAELTIERAKRLVETGRDVVIILDGITRLARAYNLSTPASGRVMSGGVDSGALYPPKKFFGAARNIEEGGSLTILATALVETGSKMDEVIFEEFKGTGNMELRLDRRLAERRVYPAIDVNASSTRHEELLFDPQQLQLIWKLRRVLNGLSQDGSAAPALELLMEKLKSTKSNAEFLSEIARSPSSAV